jgi:hypothetical protein
VTSLSGPQGAVGPEQSGMNLDVRSIERRTDGTVIVRVASRDRGPQTLPDAVFSFRSGDPQYAYWECRWQQTTSNPAQAS